MRSASPNDDDADFIGVGSLTAIPEPASILLLALGLFLLKRRSLADKASRIVPAGNKRR